ncbi:MAG: hypothetical protein DRI90_14640 [Deltaproteobacteria bacterium]|nr:MAG: hypothetical protein DRI90_14640 [Deltaproteobacteria bacterium]
MLACSAPAERPTDPSEPLAGDEPALPPATTPVATAEPTAPPPPPPTAPASSTARPPFGGFKCQLPAPKVSDDPCSGDGDCKPSVPCHAPACVAAAKAQPGGPDTMCTRNMVCDSVDANRCGCYQGRCALIPPGM